MTDMKITNLLLAGFLSLAMAQEAVAQEAATRLARKPKTPVVDRPVSLFRFADEVNYSPKQTTFKLFAPKDAESVTLSVYAEGQGGKPLREMMMFYSSAGRLERQVLHVRHGARRMPRSVRQGRRSERTKGRNR